MDTTFVVKFCGALFALMNPCIGLPVFLRVTVGQSVAVQRQLARHLHVLHPLVRHLGAGKNLRPRATL